MVSAQDIHLPALTICETLEFARDCTQAHCAEHCSCEFKQLMGEALKHGQDPKLEMNLSMVGLKRVAGQPVGSPMRPSLTTDDQHHLNIAEMIAGTYAVYFVDQLNQGDTIFPTLSTQFLAICNTTTFKTCYEKISSLKI